MEDRRAREATRAIVMEDRRAREATRETATEDRRAREATRATATEDRRAREATRETVTEDRRAREAIRATVMEDRRAREVIRATAIIAEADRRDRADVREQAETEEPSPLIHRSRQNQRATEAIKTPIRTIDSTRETRTTTQRKIWAKAASLKRRSSRRHMKSLR